MVTTLLYLNGTGSQAARCEVGRVDDDGVYTYMITPAGQECLEVTDANARRGEPLQPLARGKAGARCGPPAAKAEAAGAAAASGAGRAVAVAVAALAVAAMALA